MWLFRKSECLLVSPLTLPILTVLPLLLILSFTDAAKNTPPGLLLPASPFVGRGVRADPLFRKMLVGRGDRVIMVVGASFTELSVGRSFGFTGTREGRSLGATLIFSRCDFGFVPTRFHALFPTHGWSIPVLKLGTGTSTSTNRILTTWY
jgi:hypothetical protein